MKAERTRSMLGSGVGRDCRCATNFPEVLQYFLGNTVAPLN